MDDQIKNKIIILDDNEFYDEKFAPSFDSQISTLQNVSNVNNAVFFIGTSPVYRKIIMKKILTKVNGNYDILVIENDKFKIIEKENIS